MKRLQPNLLVQKTIAPTVEHISKVYRFSAEANQLTTEKNDLKAIIEGRVLPNPKRMPTINTIDDAKNRLAEISSRLEEIELWSKQNQFYTVWSPEWQETNQLREYCEHLFYVLDTIYKASHEKFAERTAKELYDEAKYAFNHFHENIRQTQSSLKNIIEKYTKMLEQCRNELPDKFNMISAVKHLLTRNDDIYNSVTEYHNAEMQILERMTITKGNATRLELAKQIIRIQVALYKRNLNKDILSLPYERETRIPSIRSVINFIFEKCRPDDKLSNLCNKMINAARLLAKVEGKSIEQIKRSLADLAKHSHLQKAIGKSEFHALLGSAYNLQKQQKIVSRIIKLMKDSNISGSKELTLPSYVQKNAAFICTKLNITQHDIDFLQLNTESDIFSITPTLPF